MIRLHDIIHLDIVLGRNLFSRITNFHRCMTTSKSKDEFKSTVVSRDRIDLEKIKQSTHIYGNDSHNEIFSIANAARRKRKEGWSDSSKVTPRPPSKFAHKIKHIDENNDLIRDDLGRYILSSELENKQNEKRKVVKPLKEKNKQSNESLIIKKRGKQKDFQQDKFDTKDNEVTVDNMQDAYYKEFMKMIFSQKQPPLVYTPANGKYTQEVHSFLKDLERKMKKSMRDGRAFSGLGINSGLVKLLDSRNITKPTQVQVDSIPELIRGKSAIIESFTGSGKTLTFLLPIIQNIHLQKCSTIIIVPTRELATQIFKEALSLVLNKHDISRHVSGVDEGVDKKLSHALKDSKILIGTPKRLLELVEENIDQFKHVRNIVLDEVDKLLPVKLGSSFQNLNKVKPTEKLIAILRTLRKSPQFIATSATISNNLINNLKDMGFGDKTEIIKLIPKGFDHGKIPDNIKHFFNVVPSNNGTPLEKVPVICRLFEFSKERSILVFVRGDESVDQYVEKFKIHGLESKALYKELKVPALNSYQNFLHKFESGDIKVVVSTEETVRGIDFPFLNHVYITFVPDTPEKYVHLAGRVGRSGKPARIITMISEDSTKVEKRHWKRRLYLLGVKGKKLSLSM